MGSYRRRIVLAMVLISTYCDAEAPDKDTAEEAAEMAEMEAVARIRLNSGKGIFENMEEFIIQSAKDMMKQQNPGIEIDVDSEEFLATVEEHRMHIKTATGPNYASLFTKPETAEKYKAIFGKYENMRAYKSDL